MAVRRFIQWGGERKAFDQRFSVLDVFTNKPHISEFLESWTLLFFDKLCVPQYSGLISDTFTNQQRKS